MKKILFVLVTALVMACAAGADTIWDYEAVNADGTGSHPLVGAAPGNAVTVEGVALAGTGELWSPAMMYALFIQDEASSRGGMEIWAGSWWYDNWPPAQYVSVNAGDRVRVTGLLQDHAGKVFINDRHSDSPSIIFTVEVIGQAGIPDPELIPSVVNCNYFDQTRADGGERYQTRWTMLHGVEITAGAWANDSTLTISDATGSVGLYLPPMANLAAYPQPGGKLNVVGIFDQEDDGAGDPLQYHGNYRMIVKSYDDIAVALDACRQVRARAVGERVALAGKVVSRCYDGYFYIQDANRAGGVRVVSDRKFAEGEVVNVQGVISSPDGENVIVPRYISAGADAPRPLFVNSAALHGETGLDVFGLLVRCVGTIGAEVGNGVYEFADDIGRTVLLNSNGAAVPEQGTRVSVTAVASGDSSLPALLLSKASDIQVLLEE